MNNFQLKKQERENNMATKVTQASQAYNENVLRENTSALTLE